MLSQVFTQNSYKILSMFSISPGSRFNRKDMKEMTRLNNVPLDNAISALVSSGILKRDDNVYSVDFGTEGAKDIMEMIRKERLKMKDLPLAVHLLLTDIVSCLSSHRGVEAYLFGSYSKLVYSEKSDIDIALLTPQGFHRKDITRRAERLEGIYGKRIELHFFERDSFHRNRNDPLVRDIIRNGMPLLRPVPA